MQTSYSEPYALILWGGVQHGTRPRTKMAFIEEAKADNGNIVSYKVRVLLGTPEAPRLAKASRTLPRAQVLKTWRNPPAKKAISAAKKALPVYSQGE